MEHRLIPRAHRHGLVRWVVATSAELSILTLVADDVDKVARVTNGASGGMEWYELTALVPSPVWTKLSQEVAASPIETTDDLPEGADNLYFTPERAAEAAPVQEAPEDEKDYARRNGAWVEAIPLTTATNKIYGTNGVGAQVTYDLAATATTAASIPKRTAQGQLVAEALDDTDGNATPKDLINRAQLASKLGINEVAVAFTGTTNSYSAPATADLVHFSGSTTNLTINLPVATTLKRLTLKFALGITGTFTITPAAGDTVETAPVKVRTGESLNLLYNPATKTWEVLSRFDGVMLVDSGLGFASYTVGSMHTSSNSLVLGGTPVQSNFVVCPYAYRLSVASAGSNGGGSVDIQPWRSSASYSATSQGIVIGKDSGNSASQGIVIGSGSAANTGVTIGNYLTGSNGTMIGATGGRLRIDSSTWAVSTVLSGNTHAIFGNITTGIGATSVAHCGSLTATPGTNASNLGYNISVAAYSVAAGNGLTTANYSACLGIGATSIAGSLTYGMPAQSGTTPTGISGAPVVHTVLRSLLTASGTSQYLRPDALATTVAVTSTESVRKLIVKAYNYDTPNVQKVWVADWFDSTTTPTLTVIKEVVGTTDAWAVSVNAGAAQISVSGTGSTKMVWHSITEIF